MMGTNTIYNSMFLKHIMYTLQILVKISNTKPSVNYTINSASACTQELPEAPNCSLG